MFSHQCDGRQLIEILYDRRDHETELYSPPLFVRKRWWLLSWLTFVHSTSWLLICPETLYLCCCLRFRYVLCSLLSACAIPLIIVACPVRLHPRNWATNERTRPVLPFLFFKGKKEKLPVSLYCFLEPSYPEGIRQWGTLTTSWHDWDCETPYSFILTPSIFHHRFPSPRPFSLPAVYYFPSSHLAWLVSSFDAYTPALSH